MTGFVDAGRGGVMILNGASSSGKSTLARMVQQRLPDPFLHLSSDQLVDGGAIPTRRDAAGPFGWPGSMRTAFFAGFHRCIPAMAAAGNNLIVDHVIEYPQWRRELARLLAGFDVMLVGVHCSLEELARREHGRADRRSGEAQEHVERHQIHEFGPYDLVVDTTAGVTGHHAEELVTAWLASRPTSALFT